MKRTLAILALTALALGCGESRRYDQAIGVLIDVSGTYSDERKETVNVIKREILPNMVPGDTLIVIRIDSESYDKENVEALLTLDRRPSHANAQKLALAHKLDAFAKESHGSQHTDIPGAIMLASEYLSEVGSDSRVMLIFSDMQEDLPPGSKRALAEDELPPQPRYRRPHRVPRSTLGLGRARPERRGPRLAHFHGLHEAAGLPGRNPLT
jgi:hypothetical protein